MYIKNISQIIKEQLPIRLKLMEGSTIYGKIISMDEKNGAIKLYDGTIIPAIFISENKLLNREAYTKFKVQGFDGDNLILNAIIEEDSEHPSDSINEIANRLGIQKDLGREIIMSLIKFNLPANDENIIKLYKNLSFINKIKVMGDDDVLSFIKSDLKMDVDINSEEFIIAKSIFNSLKDVDCDLLSFLMENDISENVDNVIRSQNFIKDKFILNKIIETIAKLPQDGENVKSHTSFDSLLKQLASDDNFFMNLPNETIRNFIDNIDVLKNLIDNYNMYIFNTVYNSIAYRNSIIIKNRYKSSREIDINDVKVFISVNTPSIGSVDAYLHKKNLDLTVVIKSQEKHVKFFKNHLDRLQTSLQNKGYNIINLSAEKIYKESNIVNLSAFFNDYIVKGLDVRV